MDADIEQLAAGILEGERRAVARAITLIESDRDDQRLRGEELLGHLMPHTGQASRLGISGAPGVGKSTFIEALGLHLIASGLRIAVLAVDPSSQRSGGSILGDKTRMQKLSLEPRAFIRPSAAGMTLGGVARRTREAALICEASGCDVVLVETVGVGQSESAVAGMVDTFVLVLAPGAGDEMQGIKRGIVEVADLVIVNKADGDLLGAAQRTQADYLAAMQLLRPVLEDWRPPVLTCSALTGTGIEAVWAAASRHRQALDEAGELVRKRGRQARNWLWSEIRATLEAEFYRDPATAGRMRELETAIDRGRDLPPRAARRIVAALLGRN